MKILSVEVYHKLKKIVLVFENDREFTQEEQLQIKQEWLDKLKTNGDIEIEIKVNVEEVRYEEAPIPEFAPPQDVSYDNNVVEIPFSVEQYEEAQKESIRIAAKNMRGASGSGYEGGSYHRKNGGEYTNKGDGKYSKKKKLISSF